MMLFLNHTILYKNYTKLTISLVFDSKREENNTLLIRLSRDLTYSYITNKYYKEFNFSMTYFWFDLKRKRIKTLIIETLDTAYEFIKERKL